MSNTTYNHGFINTAFMNAKMAKSKLQWHVLADKEAARVHRVNILNSIYRELDLLVECISKGARDRVTVMNCFSLLHDLKKLKDKHALEYYVKILKRELIK